MTDVNQFHDSLNIEQPEGKKLPGMLNVLTILTFIGCAIGLIGSLYNYFTVCNKINEMNALGDDNPMAGYMESMAESMQRQCDMKMPILLITLVCLVLCFVGAMQMRKLKKSGFYTYTIGEIIPPVAMLILVGGGSGFMGAMMIVGFIIPIVFIILYATQLKHMK